MLKGFPQLSQVAKSLWEGTLRDFTVQSKLLGKDFKIVPLEEVLLSS